MSVEEFDNEEVDRLVKALAKPLKPMALTPATAPPATTAAPPPAADHGTLTPGQRWTTARVLMPAARTEPRKPFAFASALRLPALPAIPFQFQALTDTWSSALSARVFVGLGVLLSAALPHWPYAHGWSWGLVLYLSAILLNLVTGIWSAKLTWDARLPAAHTVAVGIVLWGFGLLAAETVPRLASS
jgi:hypothetical protein